MLFVSSYREAMAIHPVVKEDLLDGLRVSVEVKDNGLIFGEVEIGIMRKHTAIRATEPNR